MSKHKNYDEYYKPKKESNREHEVSNSPKAEEALVTEETVETSQEEKEETAEPMEEIKEKTHSFFEVSGSNRVNFRQQPNKDSKVIAVLAKGERVDDLGETANGWTKVKYKEFEGYMMSMFLKEIK